MFSWRLSCYCSLYRSFSSNGRGYSFSFFSFCINVVNLCPSLVLTLFSNFFSVASSIFIITSLVQVLLVLSLTFLVTLDSQCSSCFFLSFKSSDYEVKTAFCFSLAKKAFEWAFGSQTWCRSNKRHSMSKRDVKDDKWRKCNVKSLTLLRCCFIISRFFFSDFVS